MHAITWHQHGGSGYGGFDYEDLLHMSFEDLEWYAEKAEDQRAFEAKKIEEAHRAAAAARR